jgi:hypothetical protein
VFLFAGQPVTGAVTQTLPGEPAGHVAAYIFVGVIQRHSSGEYFRHPLPGSRSNEFGAQGFLLPRGAKPSSPAIRGASHGEAKTSWSVGVVRQARTTALDLE